jgi:hypothetical protein
MTKEDPFKGEPAMAIGGDFVSKCMRCSELRETLESIYEPLCDIVFVEDTCGTADPIANGIKKEAIDDLKRIAKSNKWFKERLAKEEKV